MNASRPPCHHLHPTGNRCGSPALRGEQFCFYHHPTRRPPVRTRLSDPPFYVPPIADPESLQMPSPRSCAASLTRPSTPDEPASSSTPSKWPRTTCLPT